MKTRFLFPVIAAVAIMAVFSCGKEIEQEVLPEGNTPVEQPEAVFTYSLNIDASKGADGKALTLEGNTLSATWAAGEAVTVYNETKGEALTGSLIAQSSGASTTLKGELSGSKGIAMGDELTLKFLSPNYSSQNGTLEYIAANCDYATASVSVTGVDGSDISTGTANFVNRQAIVKFTLNQANSASTVLAKTLQVIVNDNTFTVTTPSDWVNTMFVAVPAFTDKQIVLYATDVEGNTFLYTRKGVTFAEGKYYEITVTMPRGAIVYNEGELTSALYNNVPNIVLGCDIVLNSHAKVGDGDNTTTPIVTTLDLNGHTLSRNLSSIDSNGHVIEVYTDGTLTVKDSGEGGKIKGGRANNGGGICNYGTLYFQSGTITDCMANSDTDGSGRGGAIVNHGTMVMSGGTLLGCWGKDCGGVWNDGNLTISGGTITGNTSNAGGGGVVNYSTATITGGTIYNNTATTRGGGIWNGGTLTLGAALIKGNRAIIEGGGIHFSAGTATLSGTTIQENTAPDGGGIYIKDGATVTLDGSSATVRIKGNIGTNHGGGLWNIGTINMQGSIIISGNLDGHDVPSDAYLYSNLINCTGAFSSDSEIGLELRFSIGTCTSGYGSHNSSTNPFFASIGTHNAEIVNGEIVLRINNRKYIECSWDETTGKVVHTVKQIPSGVSIFTPRIADGSGPYWAVADQNMTIDGHIHANNSVYLILCDGVTVTYSKGLSIPSDKELHIYCQSYGPNMGKLIATGSDDLMCAGIGGRQDEVSGTITIHGGNVTATGGTDAAGIGSGDGDSGLFTTNDDKTAGYKDIIIFDGIINATGGARAAGIGSGDGNKRELCNGIFIYGGEVTANGGSYGAGICGGQDCGTGTVKIYGGTIKATGGTEGAGIGTGECDNEKSNFYCYIYGGTVTAKGGAYAAGIGGGQSFSGGTINISGGNVYATGGADGAGIGSGEQYKVWNSDGGKINISGGYVEARGGSGGDERASGIGGGQDADCGEIVISGGVVRAYGSIKGAGIGGDDITEGKLHTVSITGGDVYAAGGNDCHWTGSVGSYDTDYWCPISIGSGIRVITLSDDGSSAEENLTINLDRPDWIHQRSRAHFGVCTSHSGSPCTWCGL